MHVYGIQKKKKISFDDSLNSLKKNMMIEIKSSFEKKNGKEFINNFFFVYYRKKGKKHINKNSPCFSKKA